MPGWDEYLERGYDALYENDEDYFEAHIDEHLDEYADTPENNPEWVPVSAYS